MPVSCRPAPGEAGSRDASPIARWQDFQRWRRTKISVERSAALICRPTVARLCNAKPTRVWNYITSASGGIRKNEREKRECRVESATSISGLPPTVPKKPVGGRPYGGDKGLGRANENERPKPESDVESMTSTFAPRSTIPKSGPEGGGARRAGKRGRNEPGMSCEINGIGSSRLFQGFTHEGASCREVNKPRQESDAESVTHFGDAPPHRQEQIFDRSVNVLGNEEVGDFAPRDAAKTNTRDLRYAVAIRYKNYGQNNPNAVIFRAIHWLRRKSVRFSGNLHADRSIKKFRPYIPRW